MVSILCTLSAIAPAAEPGKTLSVEDALDLKEVQSAVISPTGEYAAYELSVPREADEDPGGGYREIWIAKLDEPGSERRYTPRRADCSSPQWAPDGKSVAFLSKRTGIHEETQVYAVPIDGGEAGVVTWHWTSVGSFRFSPDGSRIAFVAPDMKTAEQEEAEKLGHDWTVVGEGETYERLWVFDIEKGQSTAVYEGELNAGRFVWTPDGGSLIFHGSKTPDIDAKMMYSRLYRVSADGGEPEMMFETEGKLGRMDVSPDGSMLAFLGAVDIYDPLAQSVFVGPIEGGEARNLTEGLEASISEITWVDDETLLLRATAGTRTTISLLDVNSGVPQVVVEGGSISSIDLHKPSGRFCAVADSPRHPGELHFGSINSANLTRLTDSNPHLGEYTLAEQEAIEWTAEDGERIEGILTYPVGYEAGGRYPMIVNPHGGPEGADRVGFGLIRQLFGGHGYVVLQPNYRGSAGRGVAWTKGDQHDLGGQEFRDVLAGIDAVTGMGIIDPDRIGIGGWSYGGYFSALGATHHSQRFKAAVMGAGISNWISFLGATDIPHENYLVHWGRWLPGNAELFWERSPLSGIENAQTPTLIIHSLGDERVPYSQAMEMYRALKDKGVETQLVLYPRAGHGVRERAHRIDLFTRELEWFDRHLK